MIGILFRRDGRGESWCLRCSVLQTVYHSLNSSHRKQPDKSWKGGLSAVRKEAFYETNPIGSVFGRQSTSVHRKSHAYGKRTSPGVVCSSSKDDIENMFKQFANPATNNGIIASRMFTCAVSFVQSEQYVINNSHQFQNQKRNKTSVEGELEGEWGGEGAGGGDLVEGSYRHIHQAAVGSTSP